MYVSKKFIEERVQLREFSDPLSLAAVLSAFFFLAKLIISFFVTKIQIRSKKLDYKYTGIIRDLTNDNKVDVYVIKKPEPNAFVAFGGGRGLYYADSLIKTTKLSEKELTAILLHEYAHYKNKDITEQILLMGSLGIAIDFIVIFLSIFGGGAVTAIAVILGWLGYDKASKEILTRPQEIKADNYAVKMGYGKHLGSALKKISKWIKGKLCKNMSNSQCKVLIDNMQTEAGYKDFETRVKDAMKHTTPKSILKGKI